MFVFDATDSFETQFPTEYKVRPAGWRECDWIRSTAWNYTWSGIYKITLNVTTTTNNNNNNNSNSINSINSINNNTAIDNNNTHSSPNAPRCRRSKHAGEPGMERGWLVDPAG